MATEATINLAYYKDVIFGFAVLIEFSGMLYYSNKQATNPDFNSTTFNLLIGMICYMSAIIVFTLVFNFDSAFYTKARQF